MSAKGTPERPARLTPVAPFFESVGGPHRPGSWNGPFEVAVLVTFGALPLVWDACYAVGAPARADQVVRTAFYLAIALVIVRLALPEGSRRTTELPRRLRHTSDLLAGALVALGTEAVGLHWILFSDAVPVLRHDWTWPVSSLELRDLGTLATESWVPDGLGSPKAFPTLYVMDVPLAFLARAFDAHAVLMFALLATALLAGLGLTLLLHRTFGIGLAATLAAIVAYVGSPFAFDELVAGHLPNLLGFALLPFVPLGAVALAGAAFADRRAVAALGLGLGLVVALSAAQIQYVVFDAAAGALAFLARPVPRGRVALAACTAALVVAAAHGQSFAHLIAPGAHGARAAGASPLEWFFTLSKPAPPTLAQSGYIGGYADANRLLPPSAQIAVLSTAAWFVAGFALARGRRAGIFFVALLLAGVVGATGVYGPFAALKLVLTNVRAMTALREAYNWQCLTTLGIVGCLALALEASVLGSARTARWAARGVRSASWALVLIGAYATLSGASAQELHVKVEGPGEAAARAVIAADPSDARVAMLPLIEPIRQDGFTYGGSEPYWAGFGGHPVVTEFDPDPAFATAALLLDEPDPEPGLRLLGRLGVKYLVFRNDLVSDLPQYWFPELFPADWSTREAYPRLQASPSVRVRSHDPLVDVYELATYRAPLSLARHGEPCAGSPALLALAAWPGAIGACPRTPVGAASRDADVRRVPLSGDPATFDPAKAWISSTKLFSLGAAFAAADGAVATTGATLGIQAFPARGGDDVAVPCVALHAPLAAIDGGAFRPLRCGGDLDGNVAWTYFRRAAHDKNTLVLVGRGGDALVGPLATGADLEANAGAARTPYAVPELSTPAQTLAYRRIAPDRLVGNVVAPAGATLLFSDAYDDRWRLHLADGTSLAPTRANGLEAAFALPPGEHAFTLAFEPSRADAALDAMQGATWPLAALAAGALAVAARRSRVSARRGAP
jgi:hypothetical protein